MQWYEIVLISLACITGYVFSIYSIYTLFKDNKTINVTVIGVATYLSKMIYFTSIKYKRGYYSLTTKDGVYLLPVCNTKIYLYKEKSHEE